jgi:hypothetical protein
MQSLLKKLIVFQLPAKKKYLLYKATEVPLPAIITVACHWSLT